MLQLSLRLELALAGIGGIAAWGAFHLIRR